MNAPLSSAPREPGFVLVGVVMFVLALTILGLSLYGLSSYEGQFLNQTISSNQALDRAEGGEDMVKALLATPPGNSLANAKQAIGHESIDYACAWQDWPDTMGAMNWNKNVFLRVKATVNGVSRMVEGEFQPRQERNPYKTLFTSAGLIEYKTIDDATLHVRAGSTTLAGRIWESPPLDSTQWYPPRVNWAAAYRPIIYEPAPVAQATSFIASHITGATVAGYDVTPGVPLVGTHTITFDGSALPGGPPVWFQGPDASWNVLALPLALLTKYDFYEPNPVTMKVRGTAVWVVPRGVRFDQKVTIVKDGNNENVLVIVAGPNGRDQLFGDYRGVGIWFFAGLEIQDGVKVFLVTDGSTRIEDFAGLTPNLNANSLSVCSNGIFFMGPQIISIFRMSLGYDPSMDATVDNLLGIGALPSAGGSVTSSFTLVPGSWREP